MGVRDKIEMYEGETKTIRVTVRDKLTNVLIDLSGETIEFQVKDADGQGDPPRISKSVGSGITIPVQTGDDLGAADILIDSADTVGLACGTYRYDVVIVISGVRSVIVTPSDFVVYDVVNQV